MKIGSRWKAACLASTVIIAGCKRDASKTAFESGLARPDTYPTMLNADLPFRYPPALYAEKVQGNVTLRLFVDADGNVSADSTRVVESSRVPMLDSAAIKGAKDLRFVPAKLRGTAVPVSILFPVYFRHPEATPPPGDTILKRVPVPGADSARADSMHRDSVQRADSIAKAKSAKKHTPAKRRRRR